MARVLWVRSTYLELPTYPSLFPCSPLPLPCSFKTPQSCPESGKFQGQGEPLPSPTFHCLKSASAVPSFFFAGDVSPSKCLTLCSPRENNNGMEGAGKTILGTRGGAMSRDKGSSLGNHSGSSPSILALVSSSPVFTGQLANSHCS